QCGAIRAARRRLDCARGPPRAGESGERGPTARWRPAGLVHAPRPGDGSDDLAPGGVRHRGRPGSHARGRAAELPDLEAVDRPVAGPSGIVAAAPTDRPTDQDHEAAQPRCPTPASSPSGARSSRLPGAPVTTASCASLPILPDPLTASLW